MRKELRWMVGGVMAAMALAPAAASADPVLTGHSGWFWGNPRPQGNDVLALAFAGGRGYASGAFGTLLRTDDQGATFTGLAPATTQDLTDLQVIDANTLVTGGGCTLRRSDDGGQTFKRLPFTASEARCPAGVVSFSFPSSSVGFLLLSDGTVLETTDGGGTFSRQTAVPGTGATGDDTPVSAGAVAFTSPTTGYAVTQAGQIYRTTDSANSFTLVSSGNPGLAAVTFPSATVGYAVGDGNALLKSTDGGATWQPKAIDPAVGSSNLRSISCASETTCLIAVEQGNRLLRTNDGGTTVTAVTPSTQRINAAAFAGGLRVVAAGRGGATVVSDDAATTFAPVGGDLSSGGYTRGLRAGVRGTAYAPGDNGKVARTTDGGGTWRTFNVSTSEDVADVSFPTPDTGYALDTGGTVLRTANAGLSWQILNLGTAPAPVSIRALNPSTLLLVESRGLRRSTDGGRAFSIVRSRAILRSHFTSTNLAGRSVFVYGAKSLAFSRDAGRTWSAVRLPSRRRGIMQADFLSARIGWVLDRTGRLFATRSGGRRWTEVTGAGTTNVHGVSFSSSRDGFLALNAGADFGGFGEDVGAVLRTADGGRTWRRQLLGPAAIDSIAAPGGASVYALSGGSASFFATGRGGDTGRPTTLSVTTPRRTLTRRALRRVRGRVRISGRLRPAVGGEEVLFSARAASGSVWTQRAVRVASDGTFTLSVPVRRTTLFVAQWFGDGQRRGDGSPVLTVKVR